MKDERQPLKAEKKVWTISCNFRGRYYGSRRPQHDIISEERFGRGLNDKGTGSNAQITRGVG